MSSIQAIRFLHEHGERHGDIRRDHVLVDKDDGRYRWIDFDFNYRHRENIYGYDMFGLGNILAFLVGKGDVLTADLEKQGHPGFADGCGGGFQYRFSQPGGQPEKIFPYIPESLNRVLMHFSEGGECFLRTYFTIAVGPW